MALKPIPASRWEFVTCASKESAEPLPARWMVPSPPHTPAGPREVLCSRSGVAGPVVGRAEWACRPVSLVHGGHKATARRCVPSLPGVPDAALLGVTCRVSASVFLLGGGGGAPRQTGGQFHMCPSGGCGVPAPASVGRHRCGGRTRSLTVRAGESLGGQGPWWALNQDIGPVPWTHWPVRSPRLEGVPLHPSPRAKRSPLCRAGTTEPLTSQSLKTMGIGFEPGAASSLSPCSSPLPGGRGCRGRPGDHGAAGSPGPQLGLGPPRDGLQGSARIPQPRPCTTLEGGADSQPGARGCT